MKKLRIDRRSAIIGGAAIALASGLPRIGRAQQEQPRRGGGVIALTGTRWADTWLAA